MTANSYVLYGAEVSYYTGKVRSYLKWKAIPFEEITANAQIYKEVILPRVGFPVIPVVVTPAGLTLQDSSDIIDALEQRFSHPSVFPATGVQRFVAALFELYGDEWLVIPAMHYRWHHNREWAMREFGRLSAPDKTAEEQFAIGSKRAAPFAQAAVSLGAEAHMFGAIEQSYEALLGELNRHFAQMPFLLGTRPCIGDFGLYGPLYAHQYRDPKSGELMQELAPNVVAWIERMRDTPNPNAGDFLPGDEIPATLLPILQRMMREQLPELISTANALQDWLRLHPGEKIPRAIGTHDFELAGVRGKRLIGTYKLWMLQRALDVYNNLHGDDKQASDKLIDAVGGHALRHFSTLPRLRRDGLSVAID
jgi:glutathione S-transferase